MEKSSNGSTEEESGWTCYFDDFLAQKQINKPETDTSVSEHSFCSPSLVSDAASTVPWVKNCNRTMGGSLAIDDQPTMLITPKKLSFKKTRTRKISYHDDSLEDTASSPVNSPKVSRLKGVDEKTGLREDNNEMLVGRGNAFNISSVLQIDGTNQMNTKENIDTELSELKKKGLCLVPLSMLVNYIG